MEKIWEAKAQGVGLQFSGLADITGDGTKEYLFGVTIGAAAGNKLKIFKWNNNSLVKIANVHFHRMELLSNKSVGIAAWQWFIAACYVYVLKWNGQKLILDEKLYSEYYPVIVNIEHSIRKKMITHFHFILVSF